MFHTVLENKSFPQTGISWGRSATVKTERPPNNFSGIIINTSSNLEYICP